MTKMANAQQQLQAALTEFKNAQRGELCPIFKEVSMPYIQKG